MVRRTLRGLLWLWLGVLSIPVSIQAQFGFPLGSFRDGLPLSSLSQGFQPGEPCTHADGSRCSFILAKNEGGEYVEATCSGGEGKCFSGHLGEDWAVPCGTPVFAVAPGTVVFREDRGGSWGKVLILRHELASGPVFSMYAHLRAFQANNGETITDPRSKAIAASGTNGSGCHLHLEIKDHSQIGRGYTQSRSVQADELVFPADPPSARVTYFRPSAFIRSHVAPSVTPTPTPLPPTATPTPPISPTPTPSPIRTLTPTPPPPTITPTPPITPTPTPVVGTVTIGAPPTISICTPFGCGAADRHQQVYAASSFPGPMTITGMSFFVTLGPTFPGSINDASYAINLSTTSRQVNGLSADLSQNPGPDNQLFFSGRLSGPMSGGRITITGTPFLYNPASGNLLLDVQVSGITTYLPNPATFFDARGPQSSGLFSRAINAVVFDPITLQPIGSEPVVDSFGLVTEFISGTPSTPTLDQFFEPPPNLFGTANPGSAQVFTVGRTGQLFQVDVFLWNPQGASGQTLRVDVRPTAGGAPAENDSTALATVLLDTGQVPTSPGFIQLPLPAPVSVAAGEVLALVVTRPAAPGIYWLGDQGNHYTLGAGFLRNDGPGLYQTWTHFEVLGFVGIDLGFRTYVKN